MEGLLSQLILKHSLRIRFVGSPESKEEGKDKEGDLMGRVNNLLGAE